MIFQIMALLFWSYEYYGGKEGFYYRGRKTLNGSYKFPGIDHSASFPIEVVVYKDGGTVKVVTLDGMYRMKMYLRTQACGVHEEYEHAWRIEDEIVKMSVAELNK